MGLVDSMLGSSSGVGFLEDLLVLSGLFGVQVIFGWYMMFLNRVLSAGFDPLFLVIGGGMATAVVLLPFAVVFERKQWPTRLSLALLAKFILLAFGGVTLFQALMMLGIKKTSPAIASAMPNLAPGLIFIIAACFRYEKFDANCWYSKAKTLGTLLCLSGAITMSFSQTPATSPRLTTNAITILTNPSDKATNRDWILGCLYLLAGVVVLSCNTVLQAATMLSFPAPLSLCVITAVIGSLLTALVQIIMEGKIKVGSPTTSVMGITATVLVAGVVVGLCVSYQTWCIKKKGPVLVALFSPVQTVCTVVLSAVLLNQIISFGSLAGMALMFAGLYMFLWAKNNENYDMRDLSADYPTQLIDDVEKPLLA